MVSACTATRWKDSLREVHRVCVACNPCLQNHTADKNSAKKAEAATAEDGDVEPTDVGSKLESELRELRKKDADEEVFVEIARGVGFLKVPKWWPMAPSEVLQNVIQKLKAKDSKMVLRYTLRVSPIDLTCQANTSDLLQTAPPLVARYLRVFSPDATAKDGAADEAAATPKDPTSSTDELSKDKIAKDQSSMNEPPQAAPAALAQALSHLSSTKPVSYNVLTNSRNMTIDKMQVINAIVAATVKARPNWKVDLKNPDLTFLVEANPYFAGIGLAQDFYGSSKFNLMALAGEQTKPESTKDPNTDTHTSSDTPTDTDTDTHTVHERVDEVKKPAVEISAAEGTKDPSESDTYVQDKGASGAVGVKF